ncbi:hypothetical protein RBB79_14350 [Tunturiibacter empetritectus]|uniref:Uncharacterized protein n=1 Tax=Tunturiibacter lichenicola TaxID=2051959 RepID=A0A852VL04_9BACT|nr:hypothetical protein [Edaphobacter lichenicola]NYF90795.1 hypothetical protein [Edaphobacter lichenicola]
MKTPLTRTTIRGFYKKSIFASFVLTLLTTLPLHAQSYSQDADPPERVARLSILQGNVSLQPAGVDQFSQAEPNYPSPTAIASTSTTPASPNSKATPSPSAWASVPTSPSPA